MGTSRHRPAGRVHFLRALAALVIVTVALAGCGSDNAPSATAEIRTLSNRADLVSGGDALVEIVTPESNPAGLQVKLNGNDVTSAFAKRADGRITGVVTGLANGTNILTASADNAKTGQLTIVNAP